MNKQEEQLMLNYSLPTFIKEKYGIELKKSGNSYTGPCIFDDHEDSKPSFSVSYVQDKGCWMYNCFSKCGGGTIFQLVEKKDKVERGEAIRIISQTTGITNTIEGSYVDPKIESYKNTITAHANRYSNHLYSAKEAERGLKYLHSRGLTDETIKEFNLGYTPSDEYNYRRDEAYINDRISYPIYETINSKNPRVIGMCYRTLEDVYNVANWDGTKKYKLQPNTTGELNNVWKKGNNLFNYHRAYKHVKELNYVIAVEGYMDCIALWQAGIKNVVSIMSADLTDEQIKLLSNLSKNVILYLDNDDTGIQKMYKNVPKFLELGVRVKVILSPDGKDGADLCKKLKFNTEKVAGKIYGESEDATTFIINIATKQYTNAVENARRRALETCLPLVDNMNVVEKNMFLDKLSKKLEMNIRL